MHRVPAAPVAWAAPLLLLAPLLLSCSSNGCAPTTMTAADADKVKVSGPLRSSVLRARLTDQAGKGVPGKTVVFTLRMGDSDVYRGETAARPDGSAALDLKGKLQASALVALARADAFTASFAGDTQYCSSAADARFKVL